MAKRNKPTFLQDFFGYTIAFVLFTAGATSIYAQGFDFFSYELHADTPPEATQSPQTDVSTTTVTTYQKPDIYELEGNESLALVRMIIREAEAYEVDPKLMLQMARAESTMNARAVGDMDIFVDGQAVRSRGLWQISAFYHPYVSDEQAFDPVWSTKWTAQKIAEGGKRECMRLWTSCRNYYRGK